MLEWERGEPRARDAPGKAIQEQRGVRGTSGGRENRQARRQRKGSQASQSSEQLGDRVGVGAGPSEEMGFPVCIPSPSCRGSPWGLLATSGRWWLPLGGDSG